MSIKDMVQEFLLIRAQCSKRTSALKKCLRLTVKLKIGWMLGERMEKAQNLKIQELSPERINSKRVLFWKTVPSITHCSLKKWGNVFSQQRRRYFFWIFYFNFSINGEIDNSLYILEKKSSELWDLFPY